MANRNQQPAYPIKVRQKWYFMVEVVINRLARAQYEKDQMDDG